MEEIWVDVKDFEGLYRVSSDTTVKSVERTIIRGNGIPQHFKERILRQTQRSDGYLQVGLWKNGTQEKKLVHILVAQAFIPNVHGYTDVHHKNHDRTDNRIENLEWISKEEHTAMHGAEKAELYGKTVYQIDLKTKEIVNIWKSTCEAAKVLGFDQGHIAECCRCERKTHKGYKWSYEETL